MSATEATELSGTFVRASRTQRLIARRMVEAKTTIPEFAIAMDVEMDAAVALRDALKRDGGGGDADGGAAAGAGGDAGAGAAPIPSFNDMVLRASALALRAHPQVNASFDAAAGGFRLWDQVNVGFAVSAPGTLVVPTLFAADEKSLGEISGETRALAQAVRERAVAPEQLAGGTFTVSNLGMLGVRCFEAVINPPQAAILAVGSLRPAVVPRPDGTTSVTQLMTLTLTSDHRIVYGAEAAAFLATVRELLQAPGRL